MAELRERQREEGELRMSPCWGSGVEEQNCGVLPTSVGSQVSWVHCRGWAVASLSPPGLFGRHPQHFPPLSSHLPFQWQLRHHRCHSPLGWGPSGLTRCRDCNDGAFFALGVLVCDAGPGVGDCSCSTL